MNCTVQSYNFVTSNVVYSKIGKYLQIRRVWGGKLNCYRT